MTSSNKIIFWLSLLFTSITCGSIFYLINYTGNEGFNPSDDGVILAQAFRIFNGEIPHKDFISLKPTLSGFIHSIHFYSPLPLQTSARWFVLFEFLIFSFAWVFILFHAFDFKIASKIKLFVYFTIALITTFLLNLNTYNLFPWTTVDAICLMSISLLFLKDFGNLTSRKLSLIVFGLIFISLSALTRQSYVLPTIFLFGFTALHYWNRKQYIKLFLAIFLGALPFWVYFGYLFFNDALGLFFAQMQGRTELFDASVLQYIKRFIKTPLLPINILFIVSLFVIQIWFKRDVFASFKENIQHFFIRNKKLFNLIMLGYLVLNTFFCFYLLLVYDPMYYTAPFALFWIMIYIIIFTYIMTKPTKKQIWIFMLAVLFTWSSSISMGANTPVFLSGMLACTNFGLILYMLNKVNRLSILKWELAIYSTVIIGTVILFYTSIYAQRKYNYRDQSASKLGYSLSSLIPEFGSIKTNKITYEYYAEFVRLSSQFPNIKNHFVLLPNNAAIYPLMNSRNPFPVDWLQHDEYIGHEKMLYNKIDKAFEKDVIYIFIDKFNSKNMAFRLDKMIFNGNNYNASNEQNDLFLKKYKVEKYDYIPLIVSKCEILNIESKYFWILKSKN